MSLDWTNLSPDERDARITSLLLGELAPAEADELRQLIAADPELSRACARRERTIALLRDAATRQHPAGETAGSEPGRQSDGLLAAAAPAGLSDERRQKLLSMFKSPATPRRVRKVLRFPRVRIPAWSIPMSAAAILIGFLVVAVTELGDIGPWPTKREQSQRVLLRKDSKSSIIGIHDSDFDSDSLKSSVANGEARDRVSLYAGTKPDANGRVLISGQSSSEDRFKTPVPSASGPRVVFNNVANLGLPEGGSAARPSRLAIVGSEFVVPDEKAAGNKRSAEPSIILNEHMFDAPRKLEAQVQDVEFKEKSLGALTTDGTRFADTVISIGGSNFVNGSTVSFSLGDNMALPSAAVVATPAKPNDPGSFTISNGVGRDSGSQLPQIVADGFGYAGIAPANNSQWMLSQSGKSFGSSPTDSVELFTQVPPAAQTGIGSGASGWGGQVASAEGMAFGNRLNQAVNRAAGAAEDGINRFGGGGGAGGFGRGRGEADRNLGQAAQYAASDPNRASTPTTMAPAQPARRTRFLNDWSSTQQIDDKAIAEVNTPAPVVDLAGLPSDVSRVGGRSAQPVEGAALETLGSQDPNHVDAARLVQDGKLYYESGRLKEAEGSLQQAAQIDPKNVGAAYYLDLVNARRLASEARAREANSKGTLIELQKEWEKPVVAARLEDKNVDSAGLPIVLNSEDRLTRPSSEGSAQRRMKVNTVGAQSRIAASFAGEYLLTNGLRKDPSQGTTVQAKDAVSGLIIPLEDAKQVVAQQQRQLSDEGARKSGVAVPAPIPQPEVLTRENAFSTFSLNVSDVSFKLAAASLEKGAMPDAASIRSEEFINAFDYRDAMPAPGAPLAFAWERARYPFAHNRDVVRFSIKTAAQGREAGKPLNIVLALDNSGSMERADRVRIIQESLRTLAAQLKPQDKLSVVTFARTASLRVDGVSGTNAADVASQLGGLTPEGGTNIEDALGLAYRTALRHYEATAINRVVLLSDGAGNLGDVDPQSLKAKVESFRQQGIALDCFGIGWEGFNDDLLEQLSRNGDGRYGFVNTPEEAAAEFVGQLAGALRVAASDVKMQVEFNPKRVSAWRQIGYAKHQLTKEQFRDNKVDAAEIGAAESGNALYVIETNPNGEGPIATVRARFRIPQTGDYREHEWVVPFGSAVELEQANPALRLASTAAAFSEWLAVNPFAGDVSTDRLLRILSGIPETYGADPRPKKLEWMIRQAKSISGK